MIPFSLYIKEYFWSYDQKVLHIFLLFSLYFSSLNLKYLKLTKMELTRFAMKLLIYWIVCTISLLFSVLKYVCYF